LDREEPDRDSGRSRSVSSEFAFPVVEGLDGDAFALAERSNGQARSGKALQTVSPRLSQCRTRKITNTVYHEVFPWLASDPPRLLSLSSDVIGRARTVQVEMVCACYHDAQTLYQQHNTHTICVDEMTGIQALERSAATKEMKPGVIQRREFEYIRHGTVTLIGNFHVVTGEIIVPTLGPTRTEEDFVAHIEQTVEEDPQAGYVFVLDNLNVHCSAALVELVNRLCGLEEPLGKKGIRGILESMESRREFLSDPSHRIRFVFTPKHSSWLNQIEIIFGVIMRKVIRRGNFTSTDDLKSKILSFIDYFNQVFAKPFKWTYTGRPLMT
jgi:hypothetical protein